jgi:RNA recognition motif-containing protein
MAKLYVGNLSFETTDESLQELFVTRGFKVASARVIRERDSNRSRGFGFVELENGEDEARAISELSGFQLEGRALVVNEARPQAPRSGGGGRGGFGGGGGRGGRGGGGGRGDRDSGHGGGGGHRRF